MDEPLRRDVMLASREPMELTYELAERLRAVGINAQSASMSGGPERGVWPTGLLRFVAEKRRKAEAAGSL